MTIQMGPSTYGPLDRLLASTSRLQEQLDGLQQQTTSGKASQSYSGLAPKASQVIDLTAAMKQGNAYVESIGYAQAKASVMQASLTQIQSIASKMGDAALTLTGTSSPEAVHGVAEQARLALQQIASLMNTKYGGDYVFAGADTANAPIPYPEAIISSGFYAQIGSQVAALATQPTTPSITTLIANTVSIASSTASGTTPFSPYLSGAGLTAAIGTVEIGSAQRVTLDLPANRNVGAVSDPAIAGTGNAFSDIMRALSVMANATGAMAANADLNTLMEDAARTLSSATGTVTEESSAIGMVQQSMTAAAAQHASMNTILEKQMSGLTDLDMAATITRLQAVSNQLQVSYKILGMVKSLSLSNFL